MQHKEAADGCHEMRRDAVMDGMMMPQKGIP